MGLVYRGEDPRLGRPVALKLLPAHLVADAAARERFEREAQAASALDHPSICTIYEIGETDDGRTFIAMALYDGATLEEKIAEGRLDEAAAVSIARQVAEGLARAHEHEIVHRDVKPANILITPRGEARILDFGVAKLGGEAGLTGTGMSIGTLAYMAPEQASADPVDARADLWALGVITYEMLAGRRPFERETPAATMGAILSVEPERLASLRDDITPELDQLVHDLLGKTPDDRPASADEVAERLRALDSWNLRSGPPTPTRAGRSTPPETGPPWSGSGTSRPGDSRAAAATADAAPTPGDRHARRDPDASPRSFRGVGIAALVGVVLAAATGVWWTSTSDARWARDEAIPEVLRLVDEDRMADAATLALEVDAAVGRDPLLEPLWPRITTSLEVRTDPAGARVLARPFDESTDSWTELGVTPLDLERVPLKPMRLRIELEGYEAVELARSFISTNQLTEVRHAGYDYHDDASYAINLRLAPEGSLPEGMIRVAGGLYGTVPLLGFGQLEPRMIPEFLIDRTEVTHAAYAEFVAEDGYDDPAWWTDALAEGAPGVTLDSAMSRFVDATNRRGPATWVLGAPPDERADHPVTGVSWFEASAYCAWRGGHLPTLYHWARAALPSVGAWVPFSPILAARSNLDSEGTVPVGSLDALSVSGAQDMLGNAREWTSTRSGERRYLLGGSWADPRYFVSDSNAPSPWSRSDGDGFRCARFEGGEPPTALAGALEFPVQEFENRASMSDEVFAVTRTFYDYDHAAPLAARVDSTATTPEGWTVEWVSVDTPYGDRLPIRIHLPTTTPPPWESVVFFPGGNVLRSPEVEPIDLVPLDFIVRAGRALVEPVYDGAFQRNDGRTLERWNDVPARRDMLRYWVQDLGRTLDYLETRSDFASDGASYLGLSLGAVIAPNLVAFEPRFRSVVMYSGGFGTASSQDAIDDQSDLAQRVRAPALLLVGNEDIVSPVEPNKRAFLAAFGTPDSARVMRVFDAGHWPLPMNDVIRETIDFLDRYGGG